jgi:hypothetical protein
MLGATDMTTMTICICLPDDTSLRLKQLAASRGVSLKKLIEELSTAALADAETRFRVLAAGADRYAALDILAWLDELDRPRT